jgi:hypothetical protein
MAKRFTGIGMVAVLTAVGGFAALGACGGDSDSGDCSTLPSCCSQIKDASDKAECLEVAETGDAASCEEVQASFVSLAECVVSTSTGGSATGCAGLSACCSSLPSADQAECSAIAADGVDAVCTDELTVYGSMCPSTTTSTGGTGCAGLSACCSTLAADEQAACSDIASNGNDSLCTTEMDSFGCSIDTGTGPGTGTGACLTLSACCSTTTDEQGCEEVVGAGSEADCAAVESSYCATATVDAGGGMGDCSTLADCCASSIDDSACEEIVNTGIVAECTAAEQSYCSTVTVDAGTGGCPSLSTCCSSISDTTEQDECNEIVSEGNATECSETLTSYTADGICG